jgi:CRP-like cAMP-binding protein
MPTRIPAFRSGAFLDQDPGVTPVFLTDAQRERLTAIATRVQLPPRTIVYREGSPATDVFAIGEGVVKSYRDLRSGRRVIHAFLFSRDLFGLAENGRYVNSVAAVTPVTLYRLPLEQLAVLLKHDGEIQFAFLAKVTHELREAQRRTIARQRRDAAGRLATFVALMQERIDPAADTVCLPMSRSDIAAFLGLTLESVSRASSYLQRRRMIRFEGRHLAHILDPAELAKLVAAV